MILNVKFPKQLIILFRDIMIFWIVTGKAFKKRKNLKKKFKKNIFSWKRQRCANRTRTIIQPHRALSTARSYCLDLRGTPCKPYTACRP